jgi:hypothetical protein
MAPQVQEHPGTRPTERKQPVDTTKSNATAHPSTHEPLECFACYEGLVFLGRLVEEDGEEVEVIEAVPCIRCTAAALAPVR